MTKFKVDLAELDAGIGGLDSFAGTVAGQLRTLERTVQTLQQEWLGAAADANAVAHQRLAAGAREMHAALVELHAAARHAHGSYAAAVTANVSTWKQLGS